MRVKPLEDTALCFSAAGVRGASRSRVQLLVLVWGCINRKESTYILTDRSSPADANMPAFAGFHEIAFTQPERWPSSVSTSMPFSLCQTYTRESDWSA